MIRLYHKKQGRQQLIEISCFLKNYGRAAEAYEWNAYKKNPEVIQTTILDSFSERYLTLIFGLIVHLNPVKQ